jgi:hypothetical protein
VAGLVRRAALERGSGGHGRAGISRVSWPGGAGRAADRTGRNVAHPRQKSTRICTRTGPGPPRSSANRRDCPTEGATHGDERPLGTGAPP